MQQDSLFSLYPKNPKHACEIQRFLREKLKLEDDFAQPLLKLAGVDVSCNRFDPEKLVYAVAVVVSYPSLQFEEGASCIQHQPFPYIPGLLGFREVPALIEAFSKLSTKPDLIFVDGHGVSHPRGLGIASHLGVMLDVATIGVAKSLLIGRIEGELAEEAGSYAPLVWKGELIGYALRSKKRCSPLFISAGHRICLDTALQLVKMCLKGYRLPEPTRLAHLASNQVRKNFLDRPSLDLLPIVSSMV